MVSSFAVSKDQLFKKTQNIVDHFQELFAQTRAAFQQERVFHQARTLAISSLVALGRRTVSGMLCASAQQFEDWSAAYRIFSKKRIDKAVLFAPTLLLRSSRRKKTDLNAGPSIAKSREKLKSALLRQEVDGRRIICPVDGGFTNQTVFRNLPENCAVIGRIRKDARLFLPPDESESVRIHVCLWKDYCNRICGVGKSNLISGTRRIFSAADRGQSERRIFAIAKVAAVRAATKNNYPDDAKSLPLSIYAGFQDKTDNHYLRIFGSAVLMSLVSGGMGYAVDSVANNDSASGNTETTTVQDEMTAALAAQSGQTTLQLLQKNLNIKPTLEIRPGYQFNVIVTKDMVFRGAYAAR